MKQMNDILAEAHRLAEKSKTWADLSNALFDPLDGLVAKRIKNASERAAFRKTEVYDQMHKLVELKMENTGVVAGAEPKKSGRFLVRLPKSMHAALEREAAAEGTSLNQLVMAKLAVRLSTLVDSDKASLIRAFCEVRDGFSADRVVADPKLDRQFLRRCREYGLSGTDFDLNWALLNARKNGLMTDLPRTKKYTVKNPDEFEYASELAVQHLRRLKDVSLDKIICDPELAEEFDQYAERLAPGYLPLEYRWMAFGLRKAGRLQAEKGPILDVPDFQMCCHITNLKASLLPKISGLYLFSSSGHPVFLSQTDDLRERIERHMNASQSLGLPKWLWDQGALDLSLAEMPGARRGSRQKAEIMLIKQLHPSLNFQRAA